MKKAILLCIVLSVVSSVAFADHPKGTAVGGVVGGNIGSSGFGGTAGLSLKLPSMPVFWAVRLYMNTDSIDIGVTGDEYFIDRNLVKEGSFKLDWYAGIGGYASLGASDGEASATVGARLPIGLSYHITRDFELWAAVAPSLGLSIAPFEFPSWGVPAEIGLRIWFK